MVSLPSLIRSLLAMQSTKRDVPPMSSVTIPYIAGVWQWRGGRSESRSGAQAVRAAAPRAEAGKSLHPEAALGTFTRSRTVVPCGNGC